MITCAFLISQLAASRSAVDIHAVKSAVGVSVPMEQKTSALKLVRTPSFGNAMVLKLKVKDPLLSKQGSYSPYIWLAVLSEYKWIYCTSSLQLSRWRSDHCMWIKSKWMTRMSWVFLLLRVSWSMES